MYGLTLALVRLALKLAALEQFRMLEVAGIVVQ
jgi:hypothetical protein